jgi:hypothetical protein
MGCLPGVVHNETHVETVDYIVDSGKKIRRANNSRSRGVGICYSKLDATDKYTWR